MDTTHPPIDAGALVKRLDADAIKQRLDDMDRERKALMILLRAALRARSDTRLGTEDAPCNL